MSISAALLTSDGVVYNYNFLTGQARAIFDYSLDFTDIDVRSDGKVFGLTFDTIYELDVGSGSYRSVAPSSISTNALEFYPNSSVGLIAGDASSSLLKLQGDFSQQGFTSLGGTSSAGDIQFIGNDFYASTFSGHILRFDAASGVQEADFNVGMSNVFGLGEYNGNLILFAGTTAYTMSATGEVRFLDSIPELSSQIYGAATIDDINGSAADDQLSGSVWDERLSGYDGSDQINGGAGDDILSGGNGSDTLFGGFGNDTIEAGAGNDIAFGGQGDGADSIAAGAGADQVYAGAGNDTVAGGADGDVLGGGLGADAIDGGAGADSIYGGGGDFADRVRGGAEADLIYVGAGNDTVTGTEGNDTIGAGAGADVVRGGSGDDIIYLGLADGAADSFQTGSNDEQGSGSGNGNDTVYAFENGRDQIDVRGSGITQFSQLSVGAAADGDAVIVLAANQTVTLEGVSAALVDASDFIF